MFIILNYGSGFVFFYISILVSHQQIQAFQSQTEVKNKSWFGVINVLHLMVKDWAILREASNAIMEESGGDVTQFLILMTTSELLHKFQQHDNITNLRLQQIQLHCFQKYSWVVKHYFNTCWSFFNFIHQICDLIQVPSDDAASDEAEEDEIPDEANADAAGHQDPEAEEDDLPQRPKSMKKTEFYKAYKSKGSHQMYCDIMNDPCLRASAEILIRVTRPLHARYQHDLLQQKPGLNLEWSADRCLGGSFSVVKEILQVATSAKLATVMRLAPPCNPPIPFDTKLLDEDMTLVSKAFQFGVHLAGNFAWSEMLHRLTLPLAANTLLSQDRRQRKRGMSQLKKITEAIVKAENLAEENAHVSACLQDLAFQNETFAREVMINLKRSGYSTDLDNPHTLEVVKAMRRFSDGSSSTKEILESTFGHLAHVVAKSSTNKAIAPSNLWMYLSSSPFVNVSGMTQNLPTPDDWVTYLAEYGDRTSQNMKQYQNAFRASSTAVPTSPDIRLPRNSRSVVKSEWRMAGPQSHYKSAAACAYLIQDAGRSFHNSGFAWAGPVHQRNN